MAVNSFDVMWLAGCCRYVERPSGTVRRAKLRRLHRQALGIDLSDEGTEQGGPDRDVRAVVDGQVALPGRVALQVEPVERAGHILGDGLDDLPDDRGALAEVPAQVHHEPELDEPAAGHEPLRAPVVRALVLLDL